MVCEQSGYRLQSLVMPSNLIDFDEGGKKLEGISELFDGWTALPLGAMETVEKEDRIMNGKALWVALEAKPGKEAEVEKFLQAGQGLVEAEPRTASWFAIKMGPSSYGIFDTFADDSGRDAHLNGKVAQALKEKAADLLAKSPSIEKIDVIASKLPK
jgi:quinol monooxygenase YgiN